MTLRHRLSHVEGRDTGTLEAILADHPPDGARLDDLLELVEEAEARVQEGATWLLRKYLERGVVLSPAQVRRLGVALDELPEGWARLHLCQAARFLDVPREAASRFAAFYRACWESPNTFLRAWAPDGFVRLAREHPGWLGEAEALLAEALGDPAASVRARARRIVGEDA